MDNESHLEKIKQEQHELLKQFEMSLKNNFTRLMNNNNKLEDSSLSDEDNSDNCDESEEEEPEKLRPIIIGQTQPEPKKETKKSDIFESDEEEDSDKSESEEPKKKEAVKPTWPDKIHIASKYGDNDRNEEEEPLENRSLNRKHKRQSSLIKDKKVKTGLNFKRQVNKTLGNEQINIEKDKKLALPLRFNRPKSTNKYKSTKSCNKNSPSSKKGDSQTGFFTNSKLNASLSRKERESVGSLDSNRNRRVNINYRKKYDRLKLKHDALENKFETLYDKHQRLLKLFHKMEEKYRTAITKKPVSKQPKKRAVNKVTVPKTITKTKAYKRPGSMKKRFK